MTNQSAINSSSRDIPIIFSGPMVQALLAGRKTMTRRLALRPNGRWTPWTCVMPGDRLWVRESVCKLDRDHRFDHPYAYKADTAPGSDGDEIRKAYGYKWTPSIHMPRVASRLTLSVTDLKVEYLQEISEADAKAEGVHPICDHGTGSSHMLHRVAFEQLWMRLHGDGEWLRNPQVVAITFTVHKSNIDAMPAKAA